MQSCYAHEAPQPAQRTPRMNAQRNRQRILEVAKDAFARSGAGTSLDDIAKHAGAPAARTGSKAPGDWWMFSSPVRGHLKSNRPPT
jgi:hypothetical protein